MRTKRAGCRCNGIPLLTIENETFDGICPYIAHSLSLSPGIIATNRAINLTIDYWFIVTNSSSFERVDSICFLITSIASVGFISDR